MCVNLETDRYLVFDKARACPLCGGRDHALLSKKMQLGLNCRTVICKECGFCFVSPPPSEQTYGAFYKEAYSSFYKKIHGASIKKELVEKKYEAAQLDLIDGYKSISSSNILEVGPGPGRFLNLTFLRGGKCEAIEPSNEYRQLLKKRGINVVSDFIDSYSSDKKYAIVYMFQVLEHFLDPVNTLRHLRANVADDGILVISVPNIWKPFRSLDRYFLRYVHQSYFSPNSLKKLLSLAGFNILHIDAGLDKCIYTPQSIYVVAQPSGDAICNTHEIDDWTELLKFLQAYRWRYYIFDAPLICVQTLKGRIKSLLAGTLIGDIYRHFRGQK